MPLLLSFMLTVALALSAAQPLWAVTFQTHIDKVQWQVEGDQFECRLSQGVAGFGSGVFVRRAGEQVRFELRSNERWFNTGKASLLAAAAPWQPVRSDIALGAVAVRATTVPVQSSQEQGTRLLQGLMVGRSPLVRYSNAQAGVLEVRLLPVKFDQAYADYLTCTAGLLPVNFEQIRQVQIGFPNGDVRLDPVGQSKLDIVLEFIKADPTINRFQIDGHADNSGNRLNNRDASRRRALAVQEYLQSHGIMPDQISVRFHGERYPLVANNSAANRAKNRRATLTLERDPSAENTVLGEPVVPDSAASSVKDE